VWRPAWNPPLHDPEPPDHANPASLLTRATNASRGESYPRGS
jgi:hypothetical protein